MNLTTTTNTNTNIPKPKMPNILAGNHEEMMQRLRNLRMTGMANAVAAMVAHPEECATWPWEYRIESMIEAQQEFSFNNKVAKNLKNARFRYPMASFDEIKYEDERGLNTDMINELCQDRWIEGHFNLVVTGAVGAGKTYIACVIGVSLCNRGIPVRYVRTDDLLRELQEARLAGTYQKVMDRYTKIPLIIMDDFLTVGLNELQTSDLLNLVDRRDGVASLMICSQCHIDEWYERLCVTADRRPVCESFLDRIMHTSWDLVIGGDISMRERLKGRKPVDKRRGTAPQNK